VSRTVAENSRFFGGSRQLSALPTDLLKNNGNAQQRGSILCVVQWFWDQQAGGSNPLARPMQVI
jgi:hypothetical protein